MDVEAGSINEAIDIFEKTQDDVSLPHQFGYVDGSFNLTTKEPEIIQLYNKGVPIGFRTACSGSID